jgi:hypothetical protein
VLRVFVWALLAGLLTYRIFFHQPDHQFRLGRGWNQEQWGNHERRNWRSEQVSARPHSTLPTNLWRIELQLSPQAEDSLRSHRQQFRGRGQLEVTHRPSAQITVHEGTSVFTNVAAHLKGAAGSFRPYDDTPAFTLNFSKHAKGQKFHGYSKISLNNSVQDPSLLNEMICREMFLSAGIPIPRAHHASVVVNDRDLGVYVVTEGWGKPFLRNHFKDDSGNLYDGGFVQDINGDLTVTSGDDPDSHPALTRLIDVLSDPVQARNWDRLSSVLDLDRFITLLAMDTLLCNWDGYALNRNNYRLFHDRSTDRIVFMPHGLDQMFGTGRRMGVDSSIDPPFRGGAARAVMSTAEGQKRYNQRLHELVHSTFDPTNIETRIREIAASLQPTLHAYNPAWAAQHAARIENLVQRVHSRFASVRTQLSQPREPLAFNPDGLAHVDGWNWVESPENRPEPTAATQTKPDAPLLIALNARDGDPSWRRRVRIEAGSYRFEGRARLKESAPGIFATLRISGQRGGFIELTDTNWVPLRFRFDCWEPINDIELVAQAAGADATVEFDPDSLHIRRLSTTPGESGDRPDPE